MCIRMIVKIRNVFVLLGPQYKHILVKGEYTLPHFGQIQPCCPNIYFIHNYSVIGLSIGIQWVISLSSIQPLESAHMPLLYPLSLRSHPMT